MSHTPPDHIGRLRRDLAFRTWLRGVELEFRTTWGLFSPREVDAGSRLLIEHFAVRPEDRTLDLGCGYGAIGIAIAAQSPGGEVHMVDKDFVAVKYAKLNAKTNSLLNCRVYLSNAFSNIPDNVYFNNVVANLPGQVGKELLSLMLHDAHRRLAPGGRICVVTTSGLRSWIRRSFTEVFDNYTKLKQGRTHTVALATKLP